MPEMRHQVGPLRIQKPIWIKLPEFSFKVGISGSLSDLHKIPKAEI
jgi:hypothetical protein